jgi:hypothetical protein
MSLTQPRQDSEYIAWALNVSEQCTSHSKEWNIDEDALTTLQSRKSESQKKRHCEPRSEANQKRKK